MRQKKTPLEILKRLLQDVNEDVARVAAKNYQRKVEELESKTR
jgi:hypothetical protein